MFVTYFKGKKYFGITYIHLMLSLSEVTVTKMSKILRSQSMIHNNFMLAPIPMIICQKLYIKVFKIARWTILIAIKKTFYKSELRYILPSNSN